jgi:hypothetical protein
MLENAWLLGIPHCLVEKYRQEQLGLVGGVGHEKLMLY